MILIPIKLLFHWEYTLFSDKPNGIQWGCFYGWLVRGWCHCPMTWEDWTSPEKVAIWLTIYLMVE